MNTQWPDVRIHLHLTTDQATLYIDDTSSGEPLFKRGWREDTGDAPEETLAAAMIAASGWDPHGEHPSPVRPCCGSGTIVVEAAQIACRIPAGMLRRFAFEKLLPFQAHVWTAIKKQADSAICLKACTHFGGDVAHRMVDFASATPSARAWPVPCSCAVAMPCSACRRREQPGVMLLNRPTASALPPPVPPGATPTNAPPSVPWVPAWAARLRTDDGGDSSPNWPRTGKELQRLDGLDAHARPQAAQQDAPERIAPRADVERPHRMPHVPLRHGQGTLRERPNKAEGGGAACRLSCLPAEGVPVNLRARWWWTPTWRWIC